MKELEEKKPRRELLGAGTLAIAGALFAGFAAACSDDDDKDDSPGPTPDGGVDATVRPLDASADTAVPLDAAVVDADVRVLNALLSAEYNAIAAYTAGGPLVQSAPDTDPLKPLSATIVAIATNIATQHGLHAAALVDAINALGGTPITKESVLFTPPAGLIANPTITNILKFATGAERAAAVAYNKAVEGLEAAKHRYLASAIEGDESQHFIILAALVLGLASPGEKLTVTTATQLPPKAFVRSVGSQGGLETLTSYFPSA
ncbi:MAG TPA: ferritin-like domain-containing protein [Polyangiales bacterium]|nr:ferritin-like domain-containing protein [Polyangiales bacterium]